MKGIYLIPHYKALADDMSLPPHLQLQIGMVTTAVTVFAFFVEE
jgi:hypothetical protein